MSRYDVKASLNEEVNQSRTRVFNANDTVLGFGFVFIDLVNKVRESVIIKVEFVYSQNIPLGIMQESKVLSERSTPIKSIWIPRIDEH